MNDVITVEEIQSTKAFENLNSAQKTFALKRNSRKIITNSLSIIQSGNNISESVGYANKSIVLEIYHKRNGIEFKPKN
jgi:hypothetical protein